MNELPGVSMEAISRSLSAKRRKWDFDYESLDRSIWPDPIPARAREHGVHPGVFEFQCAFDKVVVASIDSIAFETHTDDDGNSWHTYPGSGLTIPAMVVHAANSANPRGIVISAGLKAMDYLRHHDVRLGDIVSLARISPYQITVGFDPATNQVYQAKVVEANAIMCSFDHIQRRKSGEVKLSWNGTSYSYIDSDRQDPPHDYEEEV